MDRPGQTKGADIVSLRQQVVGDEKKELTKILKMYIRAVAWRRNCRTILVSEIWFCEFWGNVLIPLDAPQRPRFGLCRFSFVVWLSCHFGFCKFGLVNSKTQCGLRDSLWEKKYVFHDLPRHASTATISLDLAISPSCRFSLGMRAYARSNKFIYITCSLSFIILCHSLL